MSTSWDQKGNTGSFNPKPPEAIFQSDALETKQPAFGAGRSSGRAGKMKFGDIILPENLPSSQVRNVISHSCGAMPV